MSVGNSNFTFYLENALNPPILLSPSQVQEAGQTLIGITMGIAGLIILYVTLMALMRKSPAVLKLEAIAAEKFVENVHALAAALFIPNKDWRQGMSKLREMGSSLHVWGKAFTLFWILLWLCAVIVLENGLQSIESSNFTNTSQPRKDGQIQAGLVIYFVSLIGYFITRVLSYYKDKLEMRKKIAAHRESLIRERMMAATLPTSNPKIIDLVPKLRLENTNPTSTISSLPREQESKKFDQSFNYRRRLKHITPVFYSFRISILNFIQTFVLLTEFIQLASFPVRDLFRSTKFLMSLQSPQGAEVQAFIVGVRGMLASVSTGTSSPDFNYVKFAVSWWLTLIAVVTALSFATTYLFQDTDWFSDFFSIKARRYINQITTGRWIILSLPLINIFYLVILNAFIEPLSCLASNSTPSWPVAYDDIAIAAQNRIYQCYSIYQAAPTMNTWFSLSGFTLAFFLFTMCRTSQDPLPDEGVINYTSRSEVWLKMSSISLLLLYALIPTSATSTLRGVFACLILIFMSIYNTIIGSTYVRWVNFARSLCYISTLWMCAVITYYTAVGNEELLFETGAGVFNVILWGWLILWSLYVFLDWTLIRPWERKCCNESDEATASAETMKEGEMIERQTTSFEVETLRFASHQRPRSSRITSSTSTASTSVSGSRPMNPTASELNRGSLSGKPASIVTSMGGARPSITSAPASTSSLQSSGIIGGSMIVSNGRPSVALGGSRPSAASNGRPSITANSAPLHQRPSQLAINQNFNIVSISENRRSSTSNVNETPLSGRESLSSEGIRRPSGARPMPDTFNAPSSSRRSLIGTAPPPRRP